MLNKKAISAMVAYVILIAIAIGLSTMVYAWLRFYANVEDTEKCPEDVTLIISDYYCGLNASGVKVLNVTLRNKGLFSIGGFIFRVNDRNYAEVGACHLPEDEDITAELKPGESVNFEKNISLFVCDNRDVVTPFKNVTLIDVQPYVLKKSGERLMCGDIATQRVKC